MAICMENASEGTSESVAALQQSKRAEVEAIIVDEKRLRSMFGYVVVPVLFCLAFTFGSLYS